MFIIKNKFVFLTISAVIVLSSILAVILFGLKKSIDFTGGTQLEVNYTTARPEMSLVNAVLIKDGVNGAIVQQEGTNAVSIKSSPLWDDSCRRWRGLAAS